MKANKEIKGKPFDKKMTRKKAIKKAGLTALTAASLLFLDTKASAQSSSPSTPPGW